MMFFGKKSERPDAPVLHAGDDDFDRLVDHPGVTIVDFWAAWCAPCRIQGPVLDEVAIEQEERGVRVVKVDVDRAPETAARFEIRSIPTVIFYRDGEPLFEMVGLVSKPVLEREIDELLAKS